MSKKSLADQMAAATKASAKPAKARKRPPATAEQAPAAVARGRGGHFVSNRRSFPKRITLDLSEDQNDFLKDQGIDLGGSKAEVLRALIGELEIDSELRDRVAGRIRDDKRSSERL